jgi:hypothetical protein
VHFKPIGLCRLPDVPPAGPPLDGDEERLEAMPIVVFVPMLGKGLGGTICVLLVEVGDDVFRDGGSEVVEDLLV